MTHRAILFGAIGTLVDTSDMQRRAFNLAFKEAGLRWHWTRPIYAPMLATVGGRNRIRAYADLRQETVDVAALHAAKSRFYQQLMRAEGVALRPGVADAIARAKSEGMKLGWITTTSRANVDAIIDAADGALHADMFDLITDRSMVTAPKPNGEVYLMALDRFVLTASEVIAVEDTPDSARAAREAGIRVAAFEGAVAPDAAWPEGTVRCGDLSQLFEPADLGQAAA